MKKKLFLHFILEPWIHYKKKPEWFISLLPTVGVQVLGAFDDVLYITYYVHVPPYNQRLNVPISSYFTTNLLAFNSHPHVTTMQTEAKDE
jgi:hypothetical protein